MGFFHAKRALIIALASDRSIASGVAVALRREGANWRLPTRAKSSVSVSRNWLRSSVRSSPSPSL